jgi:hypothetical protein
MTSKVIINSKENALSIDLLYTVENYFTLNIKVKSGAFEGASNFCISRDNLIIAVETLSKMYDELAGVCVIADYDSDAFITLELNRLGHLSISGQIGGSHQDHSMKFKYISDQTVLMNLIDAFKSMV